MDAATRTALSDILQGYEQRRDRELTARKAEQAGLERFLAEATTALESIVTPCLAQFAEELKRHNHRCTIESQKQDEGDKRSEVKVTLTIFPNGTTLAQGNPSLSYTASAHRQKIAAHRSITTRSGGFIPGSVGEYDVAQVTSGLVDQHLLELAQTVFAGT